MIFPYPNINKQQMFSACLSRCEKISQADSGMNGTHDVLITREASSGGRGFDFYPSPPVIYIFSQWLKHALNICFMLG